MGRRGEVLMVLASLFCRAWCEGCVVETQKCNFPFTRSGSGPHYSCQATNASGGYFCRSQLGEEGQERHVYGLCNGGCYDDLSQESPTVFEENDIFSGMCKTAASSCQFPFTYQVQSAVHSAVWCSEGEEYQS